MQSINSIKKLLYSYNFVKFVFAENPRASIAEKTENFLLKFIPKFKRNLIFNINFQVNICKIEIKTASLGVLKLKKILCFQNFHLKFPFIRVMLEYNFSFNNFSYLLKVI